MKIIVCIKQVPNTTEIKIDPVTNTLKRDGVPSIINPDDKAAIEAALQLKEQCGATVTILTMGPPQAEKALREALAMGADEAFLLTDRAFGGSDTLATSTIIAAAVKKLQPDLVLCGRQAIDGDTAQVGPQIAEHMGIPQITYAAGISYNPENGKLTVKRQFEDRYQTLEVSGLCPASNLKKAIAQILLDEGYIKAFSIVDNGNQGVIHITLKYLEKKQPVISGLRRVSKPGLRVYAGAEEMPRVLKGLGIAIVSTSKGVMTDKKARELHIGGEVMAFVW